MLGIHQHILDFSIINEEDLFNISFLDKSIYMETPNMPIVEIQKPMFNQVYRIPIIPNKVTNFNSFTFGNNIYKELPDGIYTIRYCINPHDTIYVEKQILKQSKILCNLQRLLLDLDYCDKKSFDKLKKEILDIYVLLESSKAHCNDCNNTLAVEQYKLANKLTESLLKNNCI